jgi:hypothetical protein
VEIIDRIRYFRTTVCKMGMGISVLRRNLVDPTRPNRCSTRNVITEQQRCEQYLYIIIIRRAHSLGSSDSHRYTHTHTHTHIHTHKVHTIVPDSVVPPYRVGGGHEQGLGVGHYRFPRDVRARRDQDVFTYDRTMVS